MVKKKDTIFISFSSKDIGERGFIQAVANAIYSIDYEPDHMDCGVKDSNVNQDKLDERILRSRLVIMVLYQQYKNCENLRHEFEVVTERGNKITTLIFIKECITPEEAKNQKENIFNVLNSDKTRYIRFKNADDLYKKAKEQLNIWYKEEERKRKEEEERKRKEEEERKRKEEEERKRKEEEERKRKEEEERKKKANKLCLYTAAVAVLIYLLFCSVHYIKEGVLGPKTNGVKIETSTDVKDEIPTGGKNETPVDVKGETHTGNKGETPTDKNGTAGTTGKKTIPEQELSVMVPNTFAVVCDDELFSAGISDAVSQVLPTLSQSADTSKAQWTISVKQYTVQEIPKIIDSDPLQVEVYYTVDIINNANNEQNKRNIPPKRGRSIIQNRDDAIRNANEEATKEIANILKSMQQ